MFAICLLFSICSFAQEKKDTVTKTVYIFDHTDTVKVGTLMYKGADGNMKWTSPGWTIIKGRAYIENKQRFWAETPKIVGGLDKNRKPVNPITD